MKYICALLVVESIERSRHFYETIMKQKVKTDFGENICFEGDFSIHQKEHFESLIPGFQSRARTCNSELYFEEDNLVTLQDKLKEYGSEFLHEIQEQPWRQQVMRLFDPDGHIIEVGESMEHTAWRLHTEGKNTKEIARITYLSEKSVLEGIEKFSNEVISKLEDL